MVERIQKMLQKESRLCAGVMSGTSLDGLDVAICRIYHSGHDTRLELVHFETVPYTAEQRKRLLAACAPETSNVAEICSLNKWMGMFIGESVCDVVRHAKLSLSELDFIASHGQTIYHLPQEGATLQIGEPADIAAITDCLTLADFRPSDMAYGGQGAPLAPFFDWLLCRSDKYNRLLINTGGIANITALRAGGDIDSLMAFDTGPANVLSDNLMKLYTGGETACDMGGALAAGGQISEALHQSMVQEDPFLTLPPPKTTGRELYTYAYAQKLLLRGQEMGLPFEDILATVTDFSAYAIADSVKRFLPFTLDEVYQTGGGWHNLFLRERLSKRLGLPVRSLAELGIDGDAKEACFFAIFGNEFLHGRFNNAKSATGANRNVIMGKLCIPSNLLTEES